MKNLSDLMRFTEFLNKFQRIERVLYVTGEDRNENDAEHSFQLAMTAWYLNDSLELGLDMGKVLRYSLVHDLVEVYAGDTFFHITDEDGQSVKEKLEHEALMRIKDEFAEFGDLSEWIEMYEDKGDREAFFVYALDKVLPVLNIYMDEGRSWKRDGVTLEMLKTKSEKIAKDESVSELWQRLLSEIENSSVNLFE